MDVYDLDFKEISNFYLTILVSFKSRYISIISPRIPIRTDSFYLLVHIKLCLYMYTFRSLRFKK